MSTILFPPSGDVHLRQTLKAGAMKASLLTLALLTGCSVAATEKVVIESCYDGDTCTTTRGEKIRLACFDTPELQGRKANPVPAKAARDYLRLMVEGQQVGIERHTTDRYGRTVADLYMGGDAVGQKMVRSGHGVVLPKYAHQCNWARGLQ